MGKWIDLSEDNTVVDPYVALVEASRELLRLKNLKDRMEADDFLRDGHAALAYAEYQTAKPKAWAALEAALAAAPKVSEQADPAPSVALSDWLTDKAAREPSAAEAHMLTESARFLADHARIVAEKDNELAIAAVKLDGRIAMCQSLFDAKNRWADRAAAAEQRAEALAGLLTDIRPFLVDAANDFAADDCPRTAKTLRAEIARIDAAQPVAAGDARDALLAEMGLDPSRFYTDGGVINHRKVLAAIRNPAEYEALYAVPQKCSACDDSGRMLVYHKCEFCTAWDDKAKAGT